MYKIIAATVKISQKERKKMRKWVTFDGKADVREIKAFEKLKEAIKAFAKYKTDITESAAAGETYYTVTEYMLVNEMDDDYGFLGCTPMFFEIVDAGCSETIKVCRTYEEAEDYIKEHGDGRDLSKKRQKTPLRLF